MAIYRVLTAINFNNFQIFVRFFLGGGLCSLLIGRSNTHFRSSNLPTVTSIDGEVKKFEMELYNKRFTYKSKAKFTQHFTTKMALVILQRQLHMQIQQTDIHKKT